MTSSPDAAPLRVVFFSHDSQGLGHFRRNRALAHAMARRIPELTGRSVTGLLVNGVAEANPASFPDGFDVVTLPAISKTGRQYGARRLDVDMDAVTRLRAEIWDATLRGFRPDLVVVDRHAFGVEGELEEGLRQLRRHLPGCRLVLGLREVLDDPVRVTREWEAIPTRLVAELYDEIWVYGDAAIHDLRTSGEVPAELHHMVRYFGYLCHGRTEDPVGLEMDSPYLVTTAGGGSDGMKLCVAAARAVVPAGHHHLVVTGPQMSDEDHDWVVQQAAPGTRVVRQVGDAAGLIRGSAASVSMAGYNTVTETLATDVPCLLVPREWPRQEQLIRARGLEAVGAVDLLGEKELTSEAISAWWQQAVTRRVDRTRLRLAGLERVVLRAGGLETRAPLPARPAADQEGEGRVA